MTKVTGNPMKIKLFHKDAPDGMESTTQEMQLAQRLVEQVMDGKKIRLRCWCCGGKYIAAPVITKSEHLTSEEKEWIDVDSNKATVN